MADDLSNPPLQTAPACDDAATDRLIPPGLMLPFILVTALFFLWALPHNLNDILIKQFMKSFELNRFQAGLIQSAFYLGYFFLSVPAGLVMRCYGYKSGLVAGLFIYSAGTFLFWPASLARNFLFFLGALFVVAGGLAFLETGANPFIASLGDPSGSARRLNLSQAFNPFGAIGGALIGNVFIFSGVELTAEQIAAMTAEGTYDAYLRQETMRVGPPYVVIGLIVAFWGLLMLRTKFPKLGDEVRAAGEQSAGRIRDLFHHSHFVQGVAAQFFYVGAQVGTWSYYIQYVQDYVGLPEKEAGNFLIGTLVAFSAGRFSATYIMRFVEPRKLMGLYSFINIGLLAVGILHPGWIGVWAVFLTSFFMSLMFPTIFALGLTGLGPNTKIGGSMLVMAIIGGAVMPPVMGWVFELTQSMAMSMLAPLASYGFIAYYSFIGSRVKIEQC